jgi:TRAP-type C4-dicarboxylate transport system permease large subunit
MSPEPEQDGHHAPATTDGRAMSPEPEQDGHHAPATTDGREAAAGEDAAGDAAAGRRDAAAGRRDAAAGKIRPKLIVEGFGLLSVALAVLLPAINFLALRLFRMGLPNGTVLAAQAIVVLTFVSAILTSMHGDHLSLTKTPHQGLAARQRIRLSLVSFAIMLVGASLFWATLSFSILGFDPGARIGIVPYRLLALFIPAGFLGMMIADFRRLPPVARLVGGLGVLAGMLIASASIANIAMAAGWFPPFLDTLAFSTMSILSWAWLPLALLLVAAVFMGLPLYALFLGLAAILFVRNGTLIELAVTEAYGLLGSPQIAAVPLFTLTGFILAGTDAGNRLVVLFRAAFGRRSGGAVIAAVAVCAFFSIFTGSSGVAILALGPILAKVLIEAEGLGQNRARGLLTASGSVGLLFPPSMAVIIYAVNAQFSYGPERPLDIMALFRGGLLPGLLFVAVTAGAGIVFAIRDKRSAADGSPAASAADGSPVASAADGSPAASAADGFLTEVSPVAAPAEAATAAPATVPVAARVALTGSPAEASTAAPVAVPTAKALFAALPEVLLPFGIAVLFFSGTAGLMEIAALSVLYVSTAGFIRKDFVIRSYVKTVAGAFPVIGGTLLLLAAARAFSYYLIDAGIPDLAAAFITTYISSRFLFLLFLNLLLLAAGCLMDVFSAILVLAPLVIPIGDAFGVHPIHLGVIFIANLTVGFLTPPIGMNLFLGSYAFGRPVGEIWKATSPWFVLQLLVVILVTYVPLLSLWLAGV